MGRISDPLRLAVARQILQRGLSTNPDSGCLAQVRVLGMCCRRQMVQHRGTLDLDGDMLHSQSQ